MTATDTARSDADWSPDPGRWRALSVCLVAGFMTLLDVSIVNVAVPSIRDGLGADASDISWVLSGYTLAFGLALVPAGRLGDARGRRAVFLAGLAIFTLASAACGLAPSATALVVARVVQGIGGGVLSPQVSALIQQLFRGAERGRAFGLFGMTVGLSTAVGPLLGGAILASVPGADAWRWIFLVNLPVGVLALVLAWRLVPANVGGRHREPLDLPGVAILATGLLLLLAPLLQSSRGGSPAWWLGIPLGLGALAAFVGWERRCERRGIVPLVDLGLLRAPSYAYGLALGLLYFAGFTSMFFTLTLLLQSGLGFTALQAGLVQTPLALGGAVSAPLAGRVVTRVGRGLVAWGIALVLAGLVGAELVLRLVPGPAGGWWLTLPLLVAGVGSGMVISPNVTLTLTTVPVARAGSAGAVLQTGQRVGSSIGIALVGAVFFALLDGDRWRTAFEASLLVVLALVLASLAVALLDLRRHRVPAAAG